MPPLYLHPIFGRAFFSLWLLPLLLLSCNFSPEAPPYVYGRPQLAISESSEGLQRIVLSLPVENLAAVETTQLSLSFRLYDSDGIAQPPLRSNNFEIEIPAIIASGISSILEVELHTLFFHPLHNGLQLSSLCIVRMDFADGSSWIDSARLFQYPLAIWAEAE